LFWKEFITAPAQLKFSAIHGENSDGTESSFLSSGLATT